MLSQETNIILSTTCGIGMVMLGVSMLVNSLLTGTGKKIKAMLFADKLNTLLRETTESAYRAWGQNGIERFVKNGYLKPFMKKLAASEGARRNHYIAYGVMAEYLYNVLPVGLESLTLFDFPGDLSIGKLLQKLKKRAADYTAAKIRVENEGFIQAESFFGPQKIFLKIEKGNIYFIFLEDLNYYISFECQEILYHFLERRNEGNNIPRFFDGHSLSFSFLEKEKKFVAVFKDKGTEESFRFACPIASFDEAFDKALEKYSPGHKKQ